MRKVTPKVKRNAATPGPKSEPVVNNHQPRQNHDMPVVRFHWDAQLVSVRREVCPRAKWDKAARAWTMTPDEAAAFLAAGHARLSFARDTGQIAIDSEHWLIGFVQGAPSRLTKTGSPIPAVDLP
jgi:hypothetical protein